MSHLSGRLLVATPEISDGVFERSVVLVLHHDDDGAQGVCLNKPVEAQIDDILPGWQAQASEPQVVFQGGPVGLDSAIGLADVPSGADEPVGLKRLFDAVSLVDLDAPQEVVWPAVDALRIFAGYAGWTTGQLEGELERGGWFVVEGGVDDIFDPEPASLWRRVLARQSAPLSWLATYPEDLDLN